MIMIKMEGILTCKRRE